jgi:hypothetical protein
MNNLVVNSFIEEYSRLAFCQRARKYSGIYPDAQLEYKTAQCTQVLWDTPIAFLKQFSLILKNVY